MGEVTFRCGESASEDGMVFFAHAHVPGGRCFTFRRTVPWAELQASRDTKALLTDIRRGALRALVADLTEVLWPTY